MFSRRIASTMCGGASRFVNRTQNNIIYRGMAAVEWHGTTICAVRKGGMVAMAGDGGKCKKGQEIR